MSAMASAVAGSSSVSRPSRFGGRDSPGPAAPGGATQTMLSAPRLRAALQAAGGPGDQVGAGGLWSDIRVVAVTGSTNADVLAEATNGAQEGLVIAAEAQTAGRGRQGRNWISGPGTALMFSVLLRPAGIPTAVRGWIPLLAGVATATALREASAADVRLK